MSLLATLRDASEAGLEPTVDELGGSQALLDELDQVADSEYAAALLPGLLDSAHVDSHTQALVLSAVVGSNPNPFILAAVFDALVDAVELPTTIGLGIAEPVRQRVADRADAQAAARAAVVLDGAVRLALLNRLNRHVVLAELTSVTSEELPQFAATAARLTGRCHDFWPDAALRQALERLMNVVEGGDAAFELGMCVLAVSLEGSEPAEILAGMYSARGLFTSAIAAEEHRPDAEAFVAIVDAVTAFAEGGSPELVAEASQSLTRSVELHQLWLSGMHEPWAAPRALAEAEWAHFAGLLRRATTDLDAESWLRATEILPDVVRVYRATRSVTLGQHGHTASGLEAILSPRIEARFIESAGLKAHLDDWLVELSADEELGPAARELLEAVEAGEDPGKAARFRFPPGSPGC